VFLTPEFTEVLNWKQTILLFVSTRRFPPRWLRSTRLQGKMIQEENVKVSLLKDTIIRWLFQQTVKTIIQNSETRNSTEQKWLNICKIFKQVTLQNLGKKKKWHRKRGL
jgi:Cobalamin biosynthesis protein CobN and related Mg-chelatases